ncbi:MAG: 50S ribosomal protein L23, partial [Candidatus Kapabacteria bacterium]|nr:50S ribosomal protein L23 [Candidatus Kapabacteria bacterium]
MLLDIIRKPVLTEKANKINGIHAQYVFEVDPKA